MNDDNKYETKYGELLVYTIEGDVVVDYTKLSSLIKDEMIKFWDEEMKGEKGLRSVGSDYTLMDYYVPISGVKIVNLNKGESMETMDSIGLQLKLMLSTM